ncbi:MAG: NAD(P)/FAD-dependent oxidoreductase [Candidatus Dadabacteria bacterium]|nr:MAG: NAD(P)/FAD-dependent oxidoreductase [Candidatus Dadabacteria bacterium]
MAEPATTIQTERRTAPEYEAIVVGAGFSGIGAGIRLRDAGIDNFVILEQADDLGGTWRDNTYPGIAVDITSFTYSFSFEPNPDWSRVFAPGRELQAYAHHCAEKYGVKPHMRFGVEVRRAEFDERYDLWRLYAADGRVWTARFLIGATGGLIHPKMPDIPGLENFGGKLMHSARWDHSYDWSGQRVAVIGTGATAVQLVPAMAPRVKQMHVFQRTPIWILPKPDAEIPATVRRLFRQLPLTQKSVRQATSLLTEIIMVFGIVYNRQLPFLIRAIEQLCLNHLESQVDDPELRRKLTPQYGFGCKRPSFSSEYWKTFNRDNVELVTEPIQRVTKTGVTTADGRHRRVDLLICATGFKVFEPGNFPPFEVIGRQGQGLAEFWEQNRYQAYEGATVPGFPNLFLVLGPYATTGASWFSMVEAQTYHALRCIQAARRRGATRVEVRKEANDRYFQRILKRQKNTVFFNNNCGAANSYYFDSHGDAPFLRPSSGAEMWLHSRAFPLRHYRFSSTGATA